MDETEDRVLFTIREHNLETGLRGYPIGYCTTSFVHPEKGLFYANRPVSEIHAWDPEAVIYLLYHGREGTADEVAAVKNNLVARSACSQALCQSLNQLPTQAHPMRLFAMALLMMGAHEGTEDYREDAWNVVAKVPEIAARVIALHAGWGDIFPSNPGMGYMKNFMQMIRYAPERDQNLYEALRLFNILHYDHGGGNLSTFVGKAVASGLEDLYGSLASAMCALAGPRHGRANQDCLEFVQKLLDDLGPDATEIELERCLRSKLAQRELIFGFGHAVLRVEDPRAAIFYRLAEEKYAQHPLVKMALLLRKVGPKVLSEMPKIADPYPNVDAISGIVLAAAGFPYAQYDTVLFGMARVVGIARQIVYERCEARGGKGTPICRPSYVFRELTP